MADVSGLIDELTACVGGEFVQTTPLTDGYRVDGREPWVVVSPASVEQAAAVLALAHREELAVVPWGGATTMGMGQPPERMDIALRLHRLNRMREYEPADLTATAQAGITIASLQSQLGSRRQWWPLDPAWPEFATLGGVLATNSSGPKRCLYGTARDSLIGITVVHADGMISKAGGKVTKNVTGYDMMKLYIGSLGTLAVIVEATLKLRPLPPTQQVMWAAFASADAAWTAGRQLLTSQLLPSAVELVNPAVAAGLQQTVTGPESAERWSLLVGVDGAPQAVARQVREIEGICRQAGTTAWWTGADDSRLWQALQTRFRPQEADRQDCLVIRAGTVRTQVLALVARLVQIGRLVNVPVELAARLGNGIVYGTFLLNGDAGRATSLAHALAEIRGQLAAMRGYLVLESAPPSFKAQFDCWGDLGTQAQVMGELKREFDPRRVLNPGRFVHGL